MTDVKICAILIKLNETLPKTAGAVRRNDFLPAEEMRFDFSASLSFWQRGFFLTETDKEV